MAAARDVPAPARFQLIVHPGVKVTSISRARLAEIYLKTRTRWDDGTRILPVDQPIRAVVRARFLKAVYDKEPAFMLRYWHRKIFSGRGVPPVELQSDDDVIDFVADHPGAIGYITAGLRPASVRIVEMTR
ncbi:MAG TPA: hypothetical protein VNA69_07930 [Thermoanaerobaculia bacterium]|nr:hypothetical protein [Thermoanaerobaculia bacterium]